MTNQQISMVHLFIGKMADAEDLEAYVTGFYDEEGKYVSSAFETVFGIDLDPDFLEVEWFDQAGSDLQELLTGFSYDDQIKSQFPENLLSPVNSLVLAYEIESEPAVTSNGRLIYLGKASYFHG